MAGYVTKHQGSIYNGEYVAGEELENGMFVALAADGTWMKAATATLTNPLYFVENEFDDIPEDLTDESEMKIRKGKHVKAHRLLAGEEFVMTVGEALAGTLAKGDTVVPANGGLIVKGDKGAAPVGIVREKFSKWGKPAVRVEVNDTAVTAVSGS